MAFWILFQISLGFCFVLFCSEFLKGGAYRIHNLSLLLKYSSGDLFKTENRTNGIASGTSQRRPGLSPFIQLFHIYTEYIDVIDLLFHKQEMMAIKKLYFETYLHIELNEVIETS